MIVIGSVSSFLPRHRVESLSWFYHWRRLHTDALFRRNNSQRYQSCICLQRLVTDYNHDIRRRFNYNIDVPIHFTSNNHNSMFLYPSLFSIRLSTSACCGIKDTMIEKEFIQNHIRVMSSSTKSKVNYSDRDCQKVDPLTTEHLSPKEKAKRFLKKYGTVFVGTYLSIYIMTLVSIFGLLEGGLLDPDTMSQVFKVSKDFACETADVIGPPGSGTSMDEAATAYAQEISTEMTREKRSLVDIVSGYLQNYEWSSKYAEKMEQNPHLANLAVAWFIVKFTEPVRLAAAFVVVPKIAKLMGRKVQGDEMK